MKTFTSSILAAVAAAALSFSVATNASATNSTPSYNDVVYACTHATTELNDLVNVDQLDVKDIQIVWLDNVLTGTQISGILSNLTVIVEKVKVQNFLNDNADDLDVIDNDGEIVSLDDVLNANDVDAQDVVGINVTDNLVTLFCH